MFDFAWSELALIAVVALVVIGPKDLPRVMRTVGTYVRRARAIAREFQGSLEEMVRETELHEVKQHVEKATRFDFNSEFNKTVDPSGELQRSLSDPVLSNPMIENSIAAPQTVPAPLLTPPEEPAVVVGDPPSSPEEPELPLGLPPVSGPAVVTDSDDRPHPEPDPKPQGSTAPPV